MYLSSLMEKNASEYISQKAKTVIKQFGMTQALLAERAGMKPGYLSELINLGVRDGKKRYSHFLKILKQ